MSAIYYVLSFDLSVSNMCFACLADSMGLEEFLKKDTKPRRTRRVRKKDKETPTPIQEVPPSELEDAEVEVPLIGRAPKLLLPRE